MLAEMSRFDNENIPPYLSKKKFRYGSNELDAVVKNAMGQGKLAQVPFLAKVTKKTHFHYKKCTIWYKNYQKIPLQALVVRLHAQLCLLRLSVDDHFRPVALGQCHFSIQGTILSKLPKFYHS